MQPPGTPPTGSAARAQGPGGDSVVQKRVLRWLHTGNTLSSSTQAPARAVHAAAAAAEQLPSPPAATPKARGRVMQLWMTCES
jgi:hypothetical protein